MVLQSVAFVVLMVIAAVNAAIIVIYVWNKRISPGSYSFLFLMIAVMIVSITGIGEFLTTTIPGKIFWSKLSYIGLVSLSPLWFLFTINYSQRNRWLNHSLILTIWVIPLSTFLMVITNEWHLLVWPKVVPVPNTFYFQVVYGHGPIWWIHSIYAYLLMFSGTFWLVLAARGSPQYYRQRISALIIAALIPWFGNFLYLMKWNPLPGQDLTPFAFSVTGLVVVWSIFRFREFDLMPVARDAIFHNIKDGVIVIDRQNRIVDSNLIANSWLSEGNPLIGQNIFDVLPLDNSGGNIKNLVNHHGEIVFGENIRKCVYDVIFSDLNDRKGRLQGYIALLHDITHERELLSEERTHSRQLELLNNITQKALCIANLKDMLQFLANELGVLLNADGANLTLWDSEQGRTLPSAVNGKRHDSSLNIRLEICEATLTESVLVNGKVMVIEDVLNSPYLSPHLPNLFTIKSMLVMPLMANELKFGAAIIYFYQRQYFSKDEIALGEQIAAQISLAIYKTKLFEWEHQQAVQLEALHSISQAVTASLDLDKIFNTVVHVLQKDFGYPYVSIYRLVDNLLILGASFGYPEGMIYKEISIDRGIIGRTVRTRQPQYARDVTKDPDYLSVKKDVSSEICVPLLRGQDVLGTLNVESTIQKSLTEYDLKGLTVFANHIVIAIDNARLFNAEREQREFSEALRRMELALSESLDINTVLDRLLEEIKRIVPYDRASVMLLDNDNNSVRITRICGQDCFGLDDNAQALALEFKITSTANLRRMVETHSPCFVADTHYDPNWKHTPNSAHVRSWVGAPIILRGLVIGFLSLDYMDENFYNQEHADVLSVFANHAAIAIENARIFTEMQLQAEKERILFAATRDFTAGLEIKDILRAIVHHMISALSVDGCRILDWEADGKTIVSRFNYVSIPDTLKGNDEKKINLLDFPSRQFALSNKKHVLIQANAPSICENEKELLKQNQTDLLLVLPVVCGREQKVFGLIEIFRKFGNTPFSMKEIELAESLSFQAAIAIENALLFEETQQQAILDDLTGLYNRRGFLKIGRIEFDRALRFNHPLTALFLDVDHFKQFNDLYSYSLGDRVLQLLAKCIQANIRNFDLVGRYGGEEFVILLPEADIKIASEVANRIRLIVRETKISTPKGEVNITISIGIIEQTVEVASLEEMIEVAGLTLHKAKMAGRDQVAIS